MDRIYKSSNNSGTIEWDYVIVVPEGRRVELFVGIGGMGLSLMHSYTVQCEMDLIEDSLQILNEILLIDDSDEVDIDMIKMQIHGEMKNAFTKQVESVVHNRPYHSCLIQKLHHEIGTTQEVVAQSVELHDGTALNQSATTEHHMNVLQQRALRKVELTTLPYLLWHILVKSVSQLWHKHKEEQGINNLHRWRNYRVPAYWRSWPLLQKLSHEWARVSLSDEVGNKWQSRDDLIAWSHTVCSVEHSREKTAFLAPRISGHAYKLCVSGQRGTDKLRRRTIRLGKEIEIIENDLNKISLEPFVGMCVQKHEIRRADARLVFSPNSAVRRRIVSGSRSIIPLDCVA